MICTRKSVSEKKIKRKEIYKVLLYFLTFYCKDDVFL